MLSLHRLCFQWREWSIYRKRPNESGQLLRDDKRTGRATPHAKQSGLDDPPDDPFIWEGRSFEQEQLHLLGQKQLGSQKTHQRSFRTK